MSHGILDPNRPLQKPGQWDSLPADIVIMIISVTVAIYWDRDPSSDSMRRSRPNRC